MDSHDDIQCAVCRYPVRYLTRPICPECGSDLRQVGMVRPGQRRMWRLISECVLAGVAIYLVIVIAGNLLPLPVRVEHAAHVRLSPVDAGASHRYEVHGSTRVWRMRENWPQGNDVPAPMAGSIIVIASSGTQSVLDVDPTGPSAGVILQWLKSNGVQSANLADEAQMLAMLTQQPLDVDQLQRQFDAMWRGTPPASSGALYFGGAGWSMGDRSGPWYMGVAVIVAAVLYFIIVRALVRRWKRPVAYWTANAAKQPSGSTADH